MMRAAAIPIKMGLIILEVIVFIIVSMVVLGIMALWMRVSAKIAHNHVTHQLHVRKLYLLTIGLISHKVIVLLPL